MPSKSLFECLIFFKMLGSPGVDGSLQSELLVIKDTVAVASGFPDSSVLFLNRYGRLLFVGFSRTEIDPSRHLSTLKDVLERRANKIVGIERLSAALDQVHVAIKLTTNPNLVSCSITSDRRDEGRGGGVIRVVISSNTNEVLDLSRYVCMNVCVYYCLRHRCCYLFYKQYMCVESVSVSFCFLGSYIFPYH